MLQLMLTLLNKKLIKNLVAVFAVFSFLVHILIAMMINSDFIQVGQIEDISYISTISTPFSIILIYEIFQLALTYRKPLLYSLVSQFKVFSLLFVRNVFKVFSDFDVLSQASDTDNLRDLTALLFMGFKTDFTALFLQKYQDPKSQKKDPNFIKKIKSLVTTFLITSIVFVILYLLLKTPIRIISETVILGGSIIKLMQPIITIMILVDVLIFIINFFYKKEYSDLFTNAIYIISAILLRLTLSVNYPFNITYTVLSAFILIINIFICKKIFPFLESRAQGQIP